MMQFRKIASRIAGMIVPVALVTGVVLGQGGGFAGQKSYVGGRFALLLGKENVGFLKSVEGGNTVADVVSEAGMAGAGPKKHIGNPKYEDFRIETAVDLDKPLKEWISSFLQGQINQQNGSVQSMDLNFRAVSQTDFTRASITEVDFPACDASGKEPGYLVVAFAPQTITRAKSFTSAAPPAGGAQKGNKTWLCSNFKLDIPGLDTRYVNKIEGLRATRYSTTDSLGESRFMGKVPGRFGLSDFTITVAEIGVATWQTWFDDFVVNGRNGDSFEKSGTLTLLTPNRLEPILTLRLSNIGVFRMATEKATANSEGVRRVKFGLYCEKIEIL